MRNMTQEEIRAMSLEDAKAALANAVYEASYLLERLEYAGKVNGNGHHARQAVAKFATDELESSWRANAEGETRRPSASSAP